MRRFDMEQWGGKEVARLLALVETERRYYQKIVAGVPIGILVVSPDLRILAANRTFRDKFLPSENLKDIFGRTLDFVLPAAEVREAALEVIRTRKPVRHRYAELHTLTERRRLRISVSYLRNTEEEEPGAEEELLVLLEDAVPAELQIDSSSEPRRLTGDTTAGEAHQRSLELRRLEREMERRLRSAELEKEQLRANWKERERVLLSAQQDLELRLQSLEAERENLETDSEQRRFDVERIEEDRIRLSRFAAELEERQAELEDARAATGSELAARETALSEVMVERDAIAAAKEELETKLRQAGEAREAAEAQKRELERRLETAESERGKLRAAEEELERRLLAAETARMEMMETAAEPGPEAKQTEQELNQLRARTSELSASLADAFSERQQLSARIAELETIAEQARAALAEQQEEAGRLAASLAAADESRRKLEADHLAAESRYEATAREVARIRELEHSLAEALDAVELERKHVAELRSENERLKEAGTQEQSALAEKISAYEQELAAARQESEELKSTLVEVQRLLNELEQAKVSLEEARDHAESKARNAEQDLEARIAAEESLKSRLQEAEESSSRLQLTVKALERLRTAEEEAAARRGAILDGVGGAIWEAEAGQLTLAFANHTARSWLGFAPGQISSGGARWLELVHPDDREAVRAIYSQVADTGKAAVHRYRIRRESGDVLPLWEQVSRIIQEDETVALRGLAVELPEAAAKAPQSETPNSSAIPASTPVSDPALVASGAAQMDSLRDFAERLSDSLGGLLTTVSGYSEFILERMGGTARYSPFLRDIEEIKKAADRASSLSRQLRVFARKQLLHTHPTNLNSILREMQNLLQRMIGEDIRLHVETDPETPILLTDPAQLEQMILNLVVNARDAMPEGGDLHLETRPCSRTEAAPGHSGPEQPGVLFSVRDSGPGMDEPTRQRIFEPFFSTQLDEGSLGLGLATVYGFVKQSGGEVSVRSAPGRGTEFRLWFPAAEAASDSPMSRQIVQSVFGTETVLIVESEEPLLALLRNVLQRKGYTVLEATSADEAMRVSREHAGSIHLLVADCRQHLSTGRPLVEALKLDRAGLRALHTPNRVHEDPRRTQQSLKIDSLLIKPFSMDAFLRKVRETLGPAMSTAAGA